MVTQPKMKDIQIRDFIKLVFDRRLKISPPRSKEVIEKMRRSIE